MKKISLFLFICFSLQMASVFSQPYCTTGLYTTGCAAGDDIGYFEFNSLLNITSTCPGGNSGYTDYTSMSTTLQAGNSYTLKVATSSPTWQQGFGVWIDYNQNFSFSDPGEFVYASPTSAINTTTFVATATVPATALSGNTRLRVRSNYTSVLTAGQSCNSFTYGETEDYSVTINNISATVSTTADGCPSDGTGSAVVSITGGTPPYTYLWSPGGQTTAIATGLAAGTYSVNITDSIGVSTNQTVVVYNTIAVSVSSVTNLSCFGDSSGTATATIGGTAPYTYLWTPGAQTTQTATGLPAGIYTVTATNADGCFNWATDTVTGPAALTSAHSATS